MAAGFGSVPRCRPLAPAPSQQLWLAVPPSSRAAEEDVLATLQLLPRGGPCSRRCRGEDRAHLHLQGSVGVKCGCSPTAAAEVSSRRGKPKPLSRRAGKPEGEETDGCLLRVFAIRQFLSPPPHFAGFPTELWWKGVSTAWPGVFTGTR